MSAYTCTPESERRRNKLFSKHRTLSEYQSLTEIQPIVSYNSSFPVFLYHEEVDRKSSNRIPAYYVKLRKVRHYLSQQLYLHKPFPDSEIHISPSYNSRTQVIFLVSLTLIQRHIHTSHRFMFSIF